MVILRGKKLIENVIVSFARMLVDNPALFKQIVYDACTSDLASIIELNLDEFAKSVRSGHHGLID
jgi:hypothetical protein